MSRLLNYIYTNTKFSLILFLQFKIEKKIIYMLTLIKEIFTWWNRQTLGTRINTLIFGKLIGKDSFGNKYYEDKKGRRWVIYYGEIEATKIPQEWFSWIHHINNKIENSHELKKYNWQKEHEPNPTGTDKAYNPNKNNDATKKKYSTWKK